MAPTASAASGGRGQLSRPEPPPEQETPPGGEPDGGSKGHRNQTALGCRRSEAPARAAAFWARMERCPTIEALEREFARERGGAAQSTMGALMMSLRHRGSAALAEIDTERRLGELSEAQVEQCMERIAENPDRYPDSRQLLEDLAESIVAGQP